MSTEKTTETANATLTSSKGLAFFPNSNSSTSRVANALTRNIAMRKDSSTFESLSDEDKIGFFGIKISGQGDKKLQITETPEYIGRKGKPVYLTTEDNQLLKALSSYIPFNDHSVEENIKLLDMMDERGEFPVGKPKPQPMEITISLLQLCKDIIGDTKEASLRIMEKRLNNLAEQKQVQTFFVNGEKIFIVSPLVTLQEQVRKQYSEIRSSKGRKKANSELNDETILLLVNVRYSSIFLHKATNEYCPLYTEKLFSVWRRNKTEIFSTLLADLESKWKQYYSAYQHAEKEVNNKHKGLKSEDRNEYYRLVAEAKKEARIYKSRTATIRDRVTTDYQSTREQRNRFFKDLQKSIDSLVEYGIITKDSHITKDRQNVIFIYNENFSYIERDAFKLSPNTK